MSKSSKQANIPEVRNPVFDYVKNAERNGVKAPVRGQSRLLWEQFDKVDGVGKASSGAESLAWYVNQFGVNEHTVRTQIYWHRKFHKSAAEAANGAKKANGKAKAAGKAVKAKANGKAKAAGKAPAKADGKAKAKAKAAAKPASKSKPHLVSDAGASVGLDFGF